MNPWYVDVYEEIWRSQKWSKSGAESVIIGTSSMQWGSEQVIQFFLAWINLLCYHYMWRVRNGRKSLSLVTEFIDQIKWVTSPHPPQCHATSSLQYVQLLVVGADFLFHPEGFSYHCYQNCLVLQSPNCKHMKDVSKYMLCSKCIFCNSSNFSAYKITVDMLMSYYFHSYSME